MFPTFAVDQGDQAPSSTPSCKARYLQAITAGAREQTTTQQQHSAELRAELRAELMSNPFVQRVANWLAQEVVVKGLAENKAFQRFALRTDHKLKEFTEKVDVTKVTEAANNLAKEASKAAESISATVQREMQATPKPREIGFKSKQDLLREAREKAAGK